MLDSTISGLATGTFLGLLGGGGSIIAVPILVYLLGMEAKQAIGTSLLIIGLASLLAGWSHFRNRNILLKPALIFGATGTPGALAGARMAELVPDSIQLAAFAVLLSVVALFMLSKRPANLAFEETRKPSMTLLISLGWLAGVLTGFLGVGGGFIIVPALTLVLKVPIKKAIGTSLLIIAINSLVGAISYSTTMTATPAIWSFALATLIAAPVSGALSQTVPQEKLRLSFALVLLLLSAWMLSKQFLG
ncbi:MAG: sulfite exporter TauE/SafE family protein [Candidatus Obscuribacterales bacterium]|nr:sulfite exporter TauE/SafE family protein [Candidatus Obscuribacterales bacterium]